MSFCIFTSTTPSMESIYLSRVASHVANFTDKAREFENVYFSKSVEPSELSSI